jgi:hypothetical protein
MPIEDSRYQLRTTIAQFFGGTTLMTPAALFSPYIEGPLQAYGLSAVYPRFGKRVPDEAFFQFGATPRGMGGVMVVHLPKVQERRLGIGGNSGGTKQDNIMVMLHLYHLAQVDYAEQAQEDLEALLDSVYYQIDTDKTLGTTGETPLITAAGESSYGIQSTMTVPTFTAAPERVEQYATVSFECWTFFDQC